MLQVSNSVKNTQISAKLTFCLSLITLPNTWDFNENLKPATGGVVHFLIVTCKWLTVVVRYETSVQTRVSPNYGSDVMETRTCEISDNF